MLILSLFPGIDLLGRGFEQVGYCVVRGPDLIFGGDIRAFHPPAGRFDGIIGGPPCQDFSTARRSPPTGYGREMLAEFIRVVEAARPDWWLMENVPGVPDVRIDGYNWQRIDVRGTEFGLKQRRLRHIQFGSRSGTCIIVGRPDTIPAATEPAAMAGDTETPWRKFCRLQGLPPDYDLPGFTVAAKKRAVGNGVPLPMAVALATAVRDRVSADVRLCACRCGRQVTGRQTYAGSACRKRAMRRRRRSGSAAK